LSVISDPLGPIVPIVPISMFAGMDLHKNYLQIAVMNEKGKVLENTRINNDLIYIGRFFDENINDEKVRVVMESSSVWYNIYSHLSEEKVLNVVLSNCQDKGYCICKDKDR